MDATEISIRFIYPLYFRNSTISVQRKGVGRTWLIIYHATYNLYNGNKPKTELLIRKQLVCYNRGQKVDLLHAWWKPFAKINKRQKQIILKEVETIRNTYLKANNAFAIFFNHTLRYKINHTSVRRLCKINFYKNAGSL